MGDFGDSFNPLSPPPLMSQNAQSRKLYHNSHTPGVFERTPTRDSVTPANGSGYMTPSRATHSKSCAILYLTSAS